LKEFFAYGVKVAGYDIRVLNEREARAAAGILFALGLISLLNSLMLGVTFMSKTFVAFFTVDFVIRVIKPEFAPSLLLGRFFVRNQTPEYVGAPQKRFAWLLGLALALPMFYYVTIHFTPGLDKVIICMTCLFLLLFEAAFSICFGCKLYGLLTKKKAQHCPGGVCEIKRKDPVQKFTRAQTVIAAGAAGAIVFSVYYYMTQYEDRTFFMKHVKTSLMTEQQLKAQEEAQYQKELEAFDKDDF
jgi:hypothetical protein